jgi:hypothetical protein
MLSMEKEAKQPNGRLQVFPQSFTPVIYSDARKSLLKTGDIALCRPGTLFGEMIAQETQSVYSHATMLGWAAEDALMIAETRQTKDARLISLSGEIVKWPGYYDVYRVRRKSFKPDISWSFVCHAAGAVYGWRHISRAWLRRKLPNGMVMPIPNSDIPQWPRSCSALIHASLRLGRGPQIQTFDCDAMPGDLSGRRYFDYVCTLFTDENQIPIHL